ncbi:type 1 fimbrial protein [Enterobacter bugandensis]
MRYRLSAISRRWLMVFTAAGFSMLGSSYAADSQLNISANIVAPTCKIAATSVNQRVDLGKGRIVDLNQPNAATAWKSFKVELNDCPDSLREVVATFSGTPDVKAADYYLNSGTANDIAVEVKDAADKFILSNGSTITTSVDTQHNAAFDMKGRMITPSGKPTSGSVSATIELSFTFR